MSRIKLAGLTNSEVARYLDNNGIAAATPEELKHATLRFIELFKDHCYCGGDVDYHDICATVTTTPFTHL